MGNASQSLNYLSHLARRLSGPNEKNEISSSSNAQTEQKDQQLVKDEQLLLDGNNSIGLKNEKELEQLQININNQEMEQQNTK